MASLAINTPRTSLDGVNQQFKQGTTPAAGANTFNPQAFLSILTKPGTGARQEYGKGRTIFSQDDPASHVYYIISGQVKLSIISAQGKEAVIDVLEQGSFFGEECMGAQNVRMFTATVAQTASIIKVDKRTMSRIVHGDREFAELFTSYLISHNVRLKENLVDQFFNSSQKRLARILLLLAHFDDKANPEPVIPWVSQETLAAMVGTTRSRVSHFMNGFRKNGFIDYDASSNYLRIHSKLQRAVL